MILKKNDVLALDIVDMTSDGVGIGKHEGMTIFVASACTGDIVEAKILKVKKSYSFAKIEKIIKKSSNRIISDCNTYLKCGGCSLRHINYDYELIVKEKKVKDAITRIGGFDNIKINDIVGADDINFYRNKSQIPIRKNKDGKLICGFFANHSHRIIEFEHCLLQSNVFNNALNALKEWMLLYKIEPYDEEKHSGTIRHLYLREAKKTKEVMVCIVVNSDKVLNHENELVKILRYKIESLKTVVINVNTKRTNVITGDKCRVIYGDGYITDELCGLKFNISPLSFYQVNRDQAERLYNKAMEYAAVSSKDILIDLYCGTGTIGLTMAKKAKKLIGVEIVEQAVEDAKRNAKLNNITNAEFICSDAKDAARIIIQKKQNPTVVILDPPRKGCDNITIKTVINMNPRRIVYISCDPATLARDLKTFSQSGYEAKEIAPFDMFPRTRHVETVVLLSKLKSSKKIEVDLDISELDLTKAEAKATYAEIKQYVLDKFGLKVSRLYIAQVKREFGLIERINYNVSKKEDAHIPQCPADK